MLARPLNTVIFDLGGVLIDWNPRYLYRQLIPSEVEIERFLTEVCPNDWNVQLDAGRSFTASLEERMAMFPAEAEWILAYHSRWPEMLGGAIDGTVEILNALHRSGDYRLFALSNWSAETFPYARERFPFLSNFETILISGEVRMVKPDPRFFALLPERYGVEPAAAVFIDDVAGHINAARALGYQTIHFTGPDALKQSLAQLGVVVAS